MWRGQFIASLEVTKILAVLLRCQAFQSPVHFDHRESIALAIGKELAPQRGHLLKSRNSARGELQERA